MSRNVVRSSILVVLATLLVTSGFAGSVAAIGHEEDEAEDGTYLERGHDLKEPTVGDDTKKAYAGTNKAAATRVRKAFLTAKKAFHEARLEIQSIKKGDESAVADVPSFFDDEDDGDG